jgi:CRISPR-associated protein Csx16
MADYFVTGHRGALDWAARRGIVAQPVAHFDPAIVRPGDRVLGSLPAHLAAAVNAAGGRYLHLLMDLPPEARRRELSADEMEAFGARLVEIEARIVGG